jgi:hypothetical protein
MHTELVLQAQRLAVRDHTFAEVHSFFLRFLECLQVDGTSAHARFFEFLKMMGLLDGIVNGIRFVC